MGFCCFKQVEILEGVGGGAVGRLCDRALAQGACAFRKDAKAPSMAAQRGPSLARDALLQAQAPIALNF